MLAAHISDAMMHPMHGNAGFAHISDAIVYPMHVNVGFAHILDAIMHGNAGFALLCVDIGEVRMAYKDGPFDAVNRDGKQDGNTK